MVEFTKTSSSASSSDSPQVDLENVLDTAEDHVKTEISATPEIIDDGDSVDLDSLNIVARRWHKIRDAVAVTADLKNSTQLGLNKWAASTASIYEAAIKPTVDILVAFGADDIDIQGDGAFGIFWGPRRNERALCAGITIKTFSACHLVPELKKRWPELPETGFKVGIAASSLLVKRVGVARTDHQEEVWPGKAVNYATKAAQCADAHELIVTATVWEWIEKNHYLTHSCGCPNGEAFEDLWEPFTIERLRPDETDRDGRVLQSSWCDTHGPDFCQAVLNGKRARPAINEQLRQQSLESKRRRDADQRLRNAQLRSHR